MTDPIVIVLPGEPRGKGRPRHSRSGHVYTPQSTREYENALGMVAKIAMMGKPLFEGPLKVSLRVQVPIPQSWSEKKKQRALKSEIFPTGKPDNDNYLKLAQDALNKIVYTDDSQVVQWQGEKVYSDSPAMIITVQPL